MALNKEERDFANRNRMPECVKTGRRNDKIAPNSGKTELRQFVPEWKPFPVEVLPGVCGRFVQQAADAIDCDPTMVAMPTLGTCAAAIGNSRRVMPKRGYTEPPILWLANIAESGSRKSPAQDAPLNSIRKREGEAIKVHDRALAEYAAMMQKHKADLTKWLQSTREGEQPREPEKPTCTRFTVDDTTLEALASRLSDSPRGLFLAVDELSGFFRRMNQYRAGGKGGDEAAYLSMHGGRPYLHDRKTGDKPTIYVPRASLCIAGTVQPGILRKLLTTDHFESGMVARFLMAYPPARVNRWTEAEVSEVTEVAYAGMIDRLLSLNMSLSPNTGELDPICLPLSEGAKRLFIPFHDEHGAEQVDLEENLSAAWPKLTGYSLRLALVIEHIAWAGGSDEEEPKTISEESMVAGIKLAKWFANETRRIYAILAMSPFENDDRKLAEKIAMNYGPVTARELMRKLPKQFPVVRSADAALLRLVAAGYGAWDNPKPTGRPGRPKDRTYIPRQIDKTQKSPETAELRHSGGTDFPFGANGSAK